jgi:hypothetical protein
MARPFLIVGLPRSRTAWLAAVCNTVPNAICYHEPVISYPSWQESLLLWRSQDREWVGIADSGMGLHLREILEEYHPRTVIIERDLEAVILAMRRLGFDGDPRKYCVVLHERLRPFRNHPLVKVMKFDELSAVGAVRSCLWHLMPGATIDGDKLAALEFLNVQADLRRVRRVIEERKADAARLLGADVVAELCI